MLSSILIIFVTSTIIYFVGKRFTRASSIIGDYFNLSRSVKGATLDAIAGTFPELMIALFSVIFFKEFGIGVGTVAGSLMFNSLVIPSIVVFLSPVVFKVSKEVIARDVIFYNIAAMIFMASIIYTSEWGVALSIIFIGAYFWYLNIIIEQTKSYQNNNPKMLGEKISVISNIVVALLSMLIMGFATYYLTESAIVIAHILGFSPFLIGFSVVAVATSLPDVVISVTNARKGSIDDSMSNLLGSNIFSILIALGVPLFIASILFGQSIAIVSAGKELVIGLFISSVISTYLLVDDSILNKKDAKFMIALYLSFLFYLFYKAVVSV